MNSATPCGCDVVIGTPRGDIANCLADCCEVTQPGPWQAMSRPWQPWEALPWPKTDLC
jgi:hypothetical protein